LQTGSLFSNIAADNRVTEFFNSIPTDLPCYLLFRLKEKMLKLFDRLCAPVTAGLLDPVPGDEALLRAKRSRLDHLYQRLSTAVNQLIRVIGLNFPPYNESKVPAVPL
jgi:hypothetical protein